MEAEEDDAPQTDCVAWQQNQMRNMLDETAEEDANEAIFAPPRTPLA